MKLKSLILFLLLSLGSFASQGAEQLLVTARIEGEKTQIKLVLVLSESYDIEEIKIAQYLNSEFIEEDIYRLSFGEMEIILLEEEEREVVKLVSENFSSHQGGDIVFDYLYEGISGKRKQLKFSLVRNADTWSLLSDGIMVTSFYFIKNIKMLIGTVGIKEIKVK